VIRNNPDIIISQVSSMSAATPEALLAKRDEILSRLALKGINAVRDGRVYISHLSVRRGPRMVGYLLYLAKCFHPELFDDIDPAAVERDAPEVLRLDLEGTWAILRYESIKALAGKDEFGCIPGRPPYREG